MENEIETNRNNDKNMKKFLILLTAVGLAAGAANAQNLLLNGDFNDPAAGSPATSWTSWSWGNGWANHENTAGKMYDGSYYLVAGASGGGGGGFFQTISATAGLTYQLEVVSGADAWWLPTGTMSLIWLDNLGVEISNNTMNTVDPAVYGQNFDIPHPWAAYSLTGMAPAGTAQVKVELSANNATGSILFDNAFLSVQPAPEPGVIAISALGFAALFVYQSRRNGTRV